MYDVKGYSGTKGDEGGFGDEGGGGWGKEGGEMEVQRIEPCPSVKIASFREALWSGMRGCVRIERSCYGGTSAWVTLVVEPWTMMREELIASTRPSASHACYIPKKSSLE